MGKEFIKMAIDNETEKVETKTGASPAMLRLPYVLAKEKGLSTDGMTPRQVWDMLKNKGVDKATEEKKFIDSQKVGMKEAPQDEPDQFFEQTINEAEDTKSESKSYRRINSNEVMSNWGHAMFSDNPDRITSYGKNVYEVDTNALPNITTLSDEIKYQFEKSIEWGELEEFANLSSDEFAELFNPTEIVESAEAWDNDELLSWFWEKIAEKKGIEGIKTNNGAIVFQQGKHLIKQVEDIWT